MTPILVCRTIRRSSPISVISQDWQTARPSMPMDACGTLNGAAAGSSLHTERCNRPGDRTPGQKSNMPGLRRIGPTNPVHHHRNRQPFRSPTSNRTRRRCSILRRGRSCRPVGTALPRLVALGSDIFQHRRKDDPSSRPGREVSQHRQQNDPAHRSECGLSSRAYKRSGDGTLAFKVHAPTRTRPASSLRNGRSEQAQPRGPRDDHQGW